MIRFVDRKEAAEYDILRAFVIQAGILKIDEIQAIEDKHDFLQSACIKEIRHHAKERAIDLFWPDRHINNTLCFYRDLDHLSGLIDHFKNKLAGQLSITPCPICNGVEGCDHTVPERERAANPGRPNGSELTQLRSELKRQLKFIVENLG